MHGLEPPGEAPAENVVAGDEVAAATKGLAVVTSEAAEASRVGQIVGNIIVEQLVSKVVESTPETPSASFEESTDLPGEQKGGGLVS